MFLLEKLKDSLSNCRIKLNEDLNKINISNNELKQEVADYLQEKEHFIQEKSLMKTEIVKKQEELYELKSLVEAMQRTILTQDSNIKKINNDKFSHKLENEKTETINKVIEEIFSLFNIDHSSNNSNVLDNIKSLEYFIRNYLNENNINNNSLEASKSEYRIHEKLQAEYDVKVNEIENRCNIQINSLEDRINQLNGIIRNKEISINELINDNNSLKSTIYDLKTQINNFENSNNLINAGNYNELESLKNQIEFYINKSKNLENEIELKKFRLKIKKK